MFTTLIYVWEDGIKLRVINESKLQTATTTKRTKEKWGKAQQNLPWKTLLWCSLLGFSLPQLHTASPTHSSDLSFKAMILVIISWCLPSSLCSFSTLLFFIFLNFVCIYQPHLKHNVKCLQYIITQFRAGRKQFFFLVWCFSSRV